MPNSRRDGFTLIELIVVLILLAVSAGVVMPILRPPVREDTREPEFAGLLRVARQAAAERGQLLQLSVSANGDWLVFAPTPDKVEVLSRGSMTQPHVALNVSISPFGSCVATEPDGDLVDRTIIDPLTCGWRTQ